MIDAATEPDSRLVARFLAGEDAAFTALVRRHGAMVRACCRRILGDGPDAEDCAAAAFVILARKARSLKPVPLGPWLHRVATRSAWRLAGVRQRRRSKEQAMESPDALPADPVTTGAAIDIAAHLPALDRAMESLPRKLRDPLVLVYLEGRTHREAAAALGVPAGSMSRLVEAGLARLRRSLGVQVGGTAAFGAALLALLPAATADAAPLPVAAIAAGNAAPSILAIAKGELFIMTLTKLGVAAAVAAIVACLGVGAHFAIGAENPPVAVPNPPPPPMPVPAVEPPADPPAVADTVVIKPTSRLLRCGGSCTLPAGKPIADLPLAVIGSPPAPWRMPPFAMVGGGTGPFCRWLPQRNRDMKDFLPALAAGEHAIGGPVAGAGPVNREVVVALCGTLPDAAIWRATGLQRQGNTFTVSLVEVLQPANRDHSLAPRHRCDVVTLGKLPAGGYELYLGITRMRQDQQGLASMTDFLDCRTDFIVAPGEAGGEPVIVKAGDLQVAKMPEPDPLWRWQLPRHWPVTPLRNIERMRGDDPPPTGLIGASAVDFPQYHRRLRTDKTKRQVTPLPAMPPATFANCTVLVRTPPVLPDAVTLEGVTWHGTTARLAFAWWEGTAGPDRVASDDPATPRHVYGRVIAPNPEAAQAALARTGWQRLDGQKVTLMSTMRGGRALLAQASKPTDRKDWSLSIFGYKLSGVPRGCNLEDATGTHRWLDLPAWPGQPGRWRMELVVATRPPAPAVDPTSQLWAVPLMLPQRLHDWQRDLERQQTTGEVNGEIRQPDIDVEITWTRYRDTDGDGWYEMVPHPGKEPPLQVMRLERVKINQE